MYQLLNFTCSTGEFMVTYESKSIDDCLNKINDHDTKTRSIIIYTPAKDEQIDEAEETRIIMDLIKRSNGQITRVSKGVTLTGIEAKKCCGGDATKCFCIIVEDKKYCEAYYCNENICWAVKCDIPCGC